MGVNSELLKSLSWFKSKRKIKTQTDLYIENNSPKEIIELIKLGNKSFGSVMENITNEYFNMDKRTDTMHDFTKSGFKIELKSARFTVGALDFRWQHIDHIDHWDFLLLAAIEFEQIRYYICSNQTVNHLIKNGFITGQGKDKKPKQGYWFFYSKLKKFDEYFVEIESEKDLLKFIDIHMGKNIHSDHYESDTDTASTISCSSYSSSS